jgi:antirestriction protein ArdC
MTMEANQASKQADHPKIDVKSEVARTLIAAMEAGDTPWQRPWSAQAMQPTNLTTNNGYRGVNRLILALSGRSSNLWCTYRQAAAKGWQVKKGEKGTMIVKVVEFARSGNQLGAEGEAGGGGGDGPEAEAGQEKRAALKRYWVFNAEQIDGVPKAERESANDAAPVERAEAVVQALVEQTGLIVAHGGNQACYIPSLDEVRLPPVRAFKSQYDMWATKLHECAHSTMHAKRLNRTEAYAKRWGDEAYALEELTAEISSAILASETGVPMSHDPAHLASHAGYLRGWIKAIERDPMAIFTAAKNADRICEYMLGLEREMVAGPKPIPPAQTEWVADYERAELIHWKR